MCHSLHASIIQQHKTCHIYSSILKQKPKTDWQITQKHSNMTSCPSDVLHPERLAHSLHVLPKGGFASNTHTKHHPYI